MKPPEKKSALRALKCAISLAVYCATVFTSWMRKIARQTRPGRCVVLYYHSVPERLRERFARQLDLLVRVARPIQAAGPIRLQQGQHYAAVTFDDGLEDFFTVALPELRARQIPSLMFVIADAAGKSFGSEGSVGRVMSMEQIRSLPPDLVAIGSHTLTHPYLPAAKPTDAARELLESRLKLERNPAWPVDTFSFPFGGFADWLLDLCREAGYRRIFTTVPEFAFDGDPDAFVVGRVRVDPTDSLLEFRLKVAGAYRWLPYAVALKRKMLSNKFIKRFLIKRDENFSGVAPKVSITD
jgi:peptidoglycan/xylan/chitin deacetylase (PgdA/CDA1 family)